MLGVYRSFEHIEVVGLILHQPQYVETCSKEDLGDALGALLSVLHGSRDKVGSRRGLSDASHSVAMHGSYAEHQDFAHQLHL